MLDPWLSEVQMNDGASSYQQVKLGFDAGGTTVSGSASSLEHIIVYDMYMYMSVQYHVISVRI